MKFRTEQNHGHQTQTDTARLIAGVMFGVAVLLGQGIIGQLIASNSLGELTPQYVQAHRDILWAAFAIIGVLLVSGTLLLLRSKNTV